MTGTRFLPDRAPFFGGSSWTPANLGASLIAWWDAEQASTITPAGAVSSWKDIVAGYDAVQTTEASKPIFNATSFGGRPGITFDGTAHRLAIAGALPAAFPAGAAPCEMWGLASQSALVGDATTRRLFSYGGGTLTLRALERTIGGGIVRARIAVGNGAASLTSQNTTTDYIGRHVVRGVFGATDILVHIDGIAGASTAAVPATAATNLAIGSSSNSASIFWSGVISSVLITLPLSAGQAAQLLAFLSARA